MTIDPTHPTPSPETGMTAQPFLFDGPTVPFPTLVQDAAEEPIQGVVYVERGDTDAVVVLHEGMRGLSD